MTDILEFQADNPASPLSDEAEDTGSDDSVAETD
jgi:hypothetical protein